MNSFLAAGVSGLNFVFFEGKGCYHTPQDTPSNLDGRSLQHQGLHALMLARHVVEPKLKDLPHALDLHVLDAEGNPMTKDETRE